MRLAIVCPIGLVNLYRATWPVCVASMAAHADRVYLVLSHRDDRPLLANLPANVTVVSDERTWFAQDAAGREVLEWRRLVDNAQLGQEIATAEGATQIVHNCSNWYVTEGAAAAMRKPVDAWGWLYRREYLAGQMFHCGRRLPLIVNPASGARFGWDGGLEYQGDTIRYESADYSACDGEAVVDLENEMELADYAAKMTFLRCYHDLLPKRRPEFDWGFWKQYHVARFRQGQRSDEPPPEALRALTRPEFYSREILEAL